jgi:general secretion pathway protein E
MIKGNVIKPGMIESARIMAQKTGRHLLDTIEESIGVTADEFVQILGATLRYPVSQMADLHEMAPDFAIIPFADAARNECLALRCPRRGLVLVVADPFNTNLFERLELQVKEHVNVWSIAHRKDVAAFLAQYEQDMRAMDGMNPDRADHEGIGVMLEELSLQSISEESSQVVKLVRSTLYDALKASVSDIHLETDARGLSIKYRIDGVLGSVASVSGAEMAEQVISRIKVMAELDIAEHRIPQDGRFKVMVQDREVDFRVSIMPSVYGEDAVLRILDRKAITDHVNGLTLDALGFDSDSMAQCRRLADEPYGMLLVTGPTGSGKTTTLYAIISEINNGRDKIITIEDPVEYQLPGVLQIPVNEKKGLSFARGLRSILRHDPDKIMVGEIRDSETAQIATQSALTGHLVLTTVHANNVFDVIGRFTNMGVDPYSFVSAIKGIMAQRLIRVNCPHCVHDETPSMELIQKSGIPEDAIPQFKFRSGKGCGQCHGGGFRGRKAIAEILIFTDAIRELIVSREPVSKIKEVARTNGTRLMRESALELVRSGETTLQEINRVTSLS